MNKTKTECILLGISSFAFAGTYGLGKPILKALTKNRPVAGFFGKIVLFYASYSVMGAMYEDMAKIVNHWNKLKNEAKTEMEEGVEDGNG